MEYKQYKVLSLIMGGLFLVAMLMVGRETAKYVTSMQLQVNESAPCVVIDAGHGGASYRPKKLNM